MAFIHIMAQLLINNNVVPQGKDLESAVGFLTMLKTTDKEILLEEGFRDSILIKDLLEAGEQYGKQKWDQAIETARNNICSESSLPPQFIP